MKPQCYDLTPFKMNWGGGEGLTFPEVPHVQVFWKISGLDMGLFIFCLID